MSNQDEMPTHVTFRVNGVPTAVPWERVPDGQRYMDTHYSDGTVATRTPIWEHDVTYWDKDGNEVPKEKAYKGVVVLYGKDRKYLQSSYLGIHPDARP